MVRKCEWECSEDPIDAGCGDILHMQGVALLPKAQNYQIGTLIPPYPDMCINVL